MVTNKMLAFLEKHEGFRAHMYKDTQGIWTIGYGHNLNEPISRAAGAEILRDDALDTAQELQKVEWYTKLNEARQLAIFDMGYNMGVEELLKFHDMIAAIKAQDWKKAHDEALDSLWAKQVGYRAEEDAELLLKGELPT